MGPADSRGISRVPRYSGTAWTGWHGFAYGALTLCGGPFQGPSATVPLRRRRRPYYPGRGLATAPVWAAARSLAATGAIVVTFFSCGYLDVSVPRVRSTPPGAVAASPPPGCPIRKSAGRRAFAPRRGLSQLVTSFVASGSHGHPPRAFVRFRLCLSMSLQSRLVCLAVSVSPLHNLVFTYSYICPYSCIYILWLCSIRSLDFSRFRYVLEVLRSQHVKDLSAVPVEDNGLEPLTPCLQSRCSTKLS